MNKSTLLQVMKADNIPEGDSGLWFITKTNLPEAVASVRHAQNVIVPPGTYTHLYRITDSTLHLNPPGEAVMEDTPFELQTHLGFVLNAQGKVLVTGLGLGCVIRGLLVNPNVQHITCIENSRDVLRLVRPYMPEERLTIIEADAVAWTAQNQETFDCAWHDVWTDRDGEEPHLDHWHAKMLMNCRMTIRCQGAWSFDKGIKKLLMSKGLHWIG